MMRLHQQLYFIMQQSQQTLPIVIKQFLEDPNKTGYSLSPFTWTNLNIKLPNLNNNSRSIEVVKNKQKNKKTPKKRKQSPSVKSNKLNQTVVKQSRYSFKPNDEQNMTIISQKLPTHRRMHTRQNHSNLNKLSKTIDLLEKRKQKQSNPQIKNGITFLDTKNNMGKYIKQGFKRQGFAKINKPAKVLWGNTDISHHHNNMKKGQHYNHLKGSFNLTNKDKLHQNMSAAGCPFYPQSFLIPSEYDLLVAQNDRVSVLYFLRVVSKQILNFMNQQQGNYEIPEMCINTIIKQGITKQSKSPSSQLLISLCYYLELMRRQFKYTSHFQKFESYQKIDFSVSQKLSQNLIQITSIYLSQVNKPTEIQYQSVDYRVLLLVLNYHSLMEKCEEEYDWQECIWISKPIASSRGAGISFIRSTPSLTSNSNFAVNHWQNKKKYQNKIFQKYIRNPLLIKDSTHLHHNKKFDIRIWVLVIINKNEPIIYKYQEGYCRLASQKYQSINFNKESHLTNFSQNKQNQQTVMMLAELFQHNPQIQKMYKQQVDELISKTITSCKDIEYQRGCFQLFGFDVMLDSYGKLFLLEVNLNPSCKHDRHPTLKQEAENMSKTMLQLITQGKEVSCWIKIHPKIEKLNNNNDIEVKPYFQYQLGDESLLNYIRVKKLVVGRAIKIASKFMMRQIFDKISGKKQGEENQNEQSFQNNEQSKENGNSQEVDGAINYVTENQYTYRSDL